MVKTRLIYLLFCLTAVLSLTGGFMATQNTIFAQNPTSVPVSANTSTPTSTQTPTPSPISTLIPTPTPLLSLQADILSYSDDSGATFNFDVTIQYAGLDRETAKLQVSTTSPGWIANVSYSGQQVNSVDIGPAQSSGPDTKGLQVSLAPPPNQNPDPGNYVVTLTASIGSLTQSIDLTGVVKAKYSFSMTSDSGSLDTNATAGKINHFAITLTNSGSVALTNINFTTESPDGWTVNYNPQKVDSIAPKQTQQVDVVITPPAGKTVAGDYIVTLKVGNDKVNSSLDVRVTVPTSNFWEWVSIIIAVVIVAGLVLLYNRLTRSRSR